MVLIGVLAENKVRAAQQGDLISGKFANAKKLILQKQYFDALGIVNSISSATVYDEKVHFYFLWIKLHGAFHKGNILDLKKIKSEILIINAISVGLAEYHYVLALLEANLKNSGESANHYSKAVGIDKAYARFPLQKIDDSESAWSVLKRKIGF